MRIVLLITILSSVLTACNGDESQPIAPPLENQVRMSFIGTEEEAQSFNYQNDLSSVECRYDRGADILKIVAYQFEQGEQLKISHTLQITDNQIKTNTSGTLNQASDAKVPGFVFISDKGKIKYTKDSNCSTYYEVSGDEIRGNVLCSALSSEINEKSFVSVEFQCLNQDYLLFEIKENMI